MILTGNEDLRVKRTIESIKSSFKQLICEKPYEKITVKELCDLAMINKKTFYHYYETLDALVLEMQKEMSMDYIQLIKDYKMPEDLDKATRTFFAYSAKQDEAYEKITLNAAWQVRRNEMIGHVNDTAWSHSKKFQKLSDFEKRLLLDFINESGLAAYRRWIEDGKRIPVEEVAEMTVRLQLGGVRKFFD